MPQLGNGNVSAGKCMFAPRRHTAALCTRQTVAASSSGHRAGQTETPVMSIPAQRLMVRSVTLLEFIFANRTRNKSHVSRCTSTSSTLKSYFLSNLLIKTCNCHNLYTHLITKKPFVPQIDISIYVPIIAIIITIYCK